MSMLLPSSGSPGGVQGAVPGRWQAVLRGRQPADHREGPRRPRQVRLLRQGRRLRLRRQDHPRRPRHVRQGRRRRQVPGQSEVEVQ